MDCCCCCCCSTVILNIFCGVVVYNRVDNLIIKMSLAIRFVSLKMSTADEFLSIASSIE